MRPTTESKNIIKKTHVICLMWMSARKPYLSEMEYELLVRFHNDTAK